VRASVLLEGGEEHGLAHPTQAGHQQGLLGPPAGQPRQQDPECLHLPVTAHKGGRTGAAPGV